MKLVIKQVIILFLLIPIFSLAQNDVPDRVARPNEFDNESLDPKYKTYKPDTTKFRLTKKDLTTLCYALNLTKEDSLKCNVNKIWLALTDPFICDSIYRITRMDLWGKYNKPLSSGWTLSNEVQYAQKIVLEGFFNPLIYAMYLPNLDKTYQSLSIEVSKLSAVRWLKEQAKPIKFPDLKEKKARQVIFLVADSLKQYGYTLMIIHPKRGTHYEKFPYDVYNIISLRKGFEKDIIRIFKNLGLKIEELSYISG